MEKFGTLKIRSFFATGRDEHGRETGGKWVALLTRHCVTREDAKDITFAFCKANPKDLHYDAEFTIRENLVEAFDDQEFIEWQDLRSMR